jgi:hypothetical protein
VANIAQRIALEGAPEINAAFAEITKAGVEAFNSLRSAAKDIGLDKDLTPQFDRAKKAPADFTARSLHQAFLGGVLIVRNAHCRPRPRRSTLQSLAWRFLKTDHGPEFSATNSLAFKAGSITPMPPSPRI